MFRKIGTYFKNFVRNNRLISILVPITLVGIIISMILCFDKPSQIVTALPLFVSIVIMMLQSEANRYAFLLGSLNSILYGVVYFSFDLPSSALSALAMSFPIQMITFIRWNKRKYKNSTVFAKLSWPMRGLGVLVGVIAVFVLNIALARTGSDYLLLDNIANVIGIFIYVLTFFSFIEYPVLQFVSLFISSINYIIVATDGNLTIVPHLVYNIYCFVCITKAAISVYKLYGEQQKYMNLEEINSENRT